MMQLQGIGSALAKMPDTPADDWNQKQYDAVKEYSIQLEAVSHDQAVFENRAKNGIFGQICFWLEEINGKKHYAFLPIVRRGGLV